MISIIIFNYIIIELPKQKKIYFLFLLLLLSLQILSILFYLTLTLFNVTCTIMT